MEPYNICNEFFVELHVGVFIGLDVKDQVMPTYEFHSLLKNRNKSNGLYVFSNSFDNPCSLCKYDLLEKNPFSLLHNLLYIDVIFTFTFYLLLW
jgi:hypothetical protein